MQETHSETYTGEPVVELRVNEAQAHQNQIPLEDRLNEENRINQQDRATDERLNNVIEVPPKKSGSAMAWVALGVMLALLVASVIIIQATYSRSTRRAPVLPASRAVADVEAPSPIQLSASFREISKHVKPAVVYINIVERSSEEPQSPEVFGLPPQQRQRRGAGSGVIVTEDGYILTNEHVVGNAGKIDVTLADGRKMEAEVIGADNGTDLAVIKIGAAGLPIAVLGDSDNVQQGDWVLALGSPFGLQQTLTAGIVSATGRELGGQNAQYSRFIQTDASINPGNSGGPLVDMQGEVIGINTLILTGSPFNQGNVGIGFAIASNVARDVFGQIVRSGKVTRGYLGVNMGNIEGPVARSLGVEPNSGVLVANVNEGTPAAKAGLRSGDIITAFDGKKVRTSRELSDAVATTPVGKSVQVDFIRNGEAQSVTVEVAERPAEFAAVRPAEPRPEQEGTRERRLGIVAQTVTPESAAQMELQINSGALVISVQPGSPAAQAGIMHGDIIHRVDRTEIKSVEDLGGAAKALKRGDEIAIQVERGGRILWLNVEVD